MRLNPRFLKVTGIINAVFLSISILGIGISVIATPVQNNKVKKKEIVATTDEIEKETKQKATTQPTTYEKLQNPVLVSVKKTRYTLNSKTSQFNPFSIVNAKGKVSYQKVFGKSFIKVNKRTGSITIKKGKLKNNTYTLKVRVVVSGNEEYKSKTVELKIIIKIKNPVKKKANKTKSSTQSSTQQPTRSYSNSKSTYSAPTNNNTPKPSKTTKSKSKVTTDKIYDGELLD